MNIVIIDYGVGNRTSVRHAFERLGVATGLSADPDRIRSADAVVLPGVGSAGPAQAALKAQGLDAVITGLQQPVLGICLGMQLLADYLEEDDAPGLGILNGSVIHLQRWASHGSLPPEKAATAGARIPHMGWAPLNAVDADGFTDPLLQGIVPGDAVYFAHSYALQDVQHALALTRHGDLLFPSVVRIRNFWGCQFHPEKSSLVGARVLSNFLAIVQNKK
ncbi:MAG: imidazole glycerol phosphate synthase subunit HisH [Bacteroidetes bacterium]|nr:imidazole glycerol phosphate synthase subunit HisH [Bacteroidota bacterium]